MATIGQPNHENAARCTYGCSDGLYRSICQRVDGRNGPEAFLIRAALQMAAVCRAPGRQAALLQRTELKRF